MPSAKRREVSAIRNYVLSAITRRFWTALAILLIAPLLSMVGLLRAVEIICSNT